MKQESANEKSASQEAESEVLLRFAPSPTGYLHAGNARVAVLNFLFARQRGGAFWLRIDDTDKARSEQMYEEAIEEDLTWLLTGCLTGRERDDAAWDKKFRQSERLALYEAAREKLRDDGRLYPCFETAEELALARRLMVRSHRPPVYDRASLDPERRRAFEAEGRKPHWRFKLEHRSLVVRDLFRGESRFDFAHTSDPVLVREDGQPLYTLTSVVDDGECGVSHIVRGEDHATNSAVQAQLFEALGYKVPRMAHVPLLRSGDGEGGDSPLSKREGASSLSLRALREGGIEARALLLYLAKLGSSKTARGDEDWQGVVRDFSFADFGRASPMFDTGHLREVNRRVISKMSWGEIRERLEDEEIKLLDSEDGEKFWRLFCENCDDVLGISDWVRRCFTEDDAKIGRELLSEEMGAVVKKLLEEKRDGGEDKSSIDWVKFLGDMGEALGIGGRLLYVPLRRGLLGCERGPDVGGIMGLLGERRVRKRLCG